MAVGVALVSVAVPPVRLKAKSLTSRAPEPDVVLNTGSENEILMDPLSAARTTEPITGDALSNNVPDPFDWVVEARFPDPS